MKKQVRSKFFGMHFGAWVVDRVSVNANKHYRFNLSRPSSDGISRKNITVCDTTMTRLSRGEVTVEDILVGKRFQRNVFRTNIYRNSTYYVFPDRK